MGWGASGGINKGGLRSMRSFLMKTKCGRWMVGATAAVVLSTAAAPALADVTWVQNNQCKIDAYSMYTNLAQYHLYSYYAQVYLDVYYQLIRQYEKGGYKNPALKAMAYQYLQIYYFYAQYSFQFLINYIYSQFYFYMCEYWLPRRWGIAD